MIMLIWMPTGALITRNVSQEPCGRNAITFATKEEAETYIQNCGRFEEDEKKLIAIVQQI